MKAQLTPTLLHVALTFQLQNVHVFSRQITTLVYWSVYHVARHCYECTALFVAALYCALVAQVTNILYMRKLYVPGLFLMNLRMY